MFTCLNMTHENLYERIRNTDMITNDYNNVVYNDWKKLHKRNTQSFDSVLHNFSK